MCLRGGLSVESRNKQVKFGLSLLFTSSHSEIHEDKVRVCCSAFFPLNFDSIINTFYFFTSFYCLQPSSLESQGLNCSSGAGLTDSHSCCMVRGLSEVKTMVTLWRNDSVCSSVTLVVTAAIKLSVVQTDLPKYTSIILMITSELLLFLTKQS